jgi:hypothetical protein
MATSERSYRDRENKASTLLDAIDNFEPEFEPADPILTVTAFGALVAQAGVINTAVETLSTNYTTNAQARADAVLLIRKTVTQALAYLRSNSAWSTNCKSAKMAADKLRGIRTRPPKPPEPPEEGTPPAVVEKKRNTGEMAFVEIASHLEKFKTACTGAAGYAPPAEEISLPTLNGLLSLLRGFNSQLNDVGTELTQKQQQRLILFYGPKGVKERFTSIKLAVTGQYGQNSANHAVAKGIKW